nr:AAA family ATPase [Streptomyces sp. CBG9]
MTKLIYPEMPAHSLVILIGPSGAGKSTLARTWPASQVLSLDALREVVADDFSVKFSVSAARLFSSAWPTLTGGRAGCR